MKFLICLSVVLFLIGCTHSKKADSIQSRPISESLVIQKLNENTYVVKDISFYQSNVLVAKMPDGTVLIASSPIDTVKTSNMLTWIKKELNPNKIIAINTHFHADGTGGNEAYSNENVEIWSSHITKDLYSKRADSMRVGLAQMIKDKKLRQDVLDRKNLPANKFFDAKEGLEWTFGDEKVLIHYPGPAHSHDNIVVYLPKQKILFGGCMLRAMDWKSLGNLQDANINRYYDSVKSLMQFPSDVVIPGQGDIGGQELIDHTMKLAKSTSMKWQKKVSND